ncbi:MAG: class II aldolase/adducin family protein [Calditrichia bacterium]
MMDKIKNEIIKIGKKLYENGFIVATEGNISFRLDENRILITASGLGKGEMTAEDLVEADLDGNPLQSGKQPSTEIRMHTRVYRERPDVSAVVHAHPPHVVSLSLAGIELDQPYLAESALLLGSVPTAPYGRPSTQQVPDSILPFIKNTDVIILSRHGSLTIGKSLTEAYYKLEILEHTAKIVWLARQAGELHPLNKSEISELMALREKVYGLTYPIIPFE